MNGRNSPYSELIKSFCLDENGTDWNDLATCDTHSTYVWFEKLKRLYETGELEVIPLRRTIPSEPHHEIWFRHVKTGLYLFYSSYSQPNGGAICESLKLVSPKTLPKHKRVVNDSDLGELERKLDVEMP